MGKQLCLAVVIDLPGDNPFDAADIYTSLKTPWSALLNGLTSANVKFEAKCEELQTRTRPRGRPRRAHLTKVPSTEAA